MQTDTDTEMLPFPGGEPTASDLITEPENMSSDEINALLAEDAEPEPEPENGTETEEVVAQRTKELLDEMYGAIGYTRIDLELADKAHLAVALDEIMEKIGTLQAEINLTADIADRRTRVIQEWFDEQVAAPRRRVAFLIVEAERISRACRTDIFGKKKSRVLPHGTVKFTQGSGSIIIDDEAKAVAFAEANTIPVETKKVVGKKDLHQFIASKGDGEFDAAVAGFRLEPSEEKFSIQVRAPETE